MTDEVLADKSQILARMAESRDALAAALDRAGPDLLERPGTWGDWRLADLLAHLTYWQDVATDRLIKFKDGRTDEIRWFNGDADIAEANENIQKANRDRPLPEMREAWEISYQTLRTAVKQLPPEVYREDQQPSPVRQWVAGNTYQHYDEHRADIEQAIQGQ